MRHSGASLVAKETGSALVVKALLQHDKIDTSMQYIHDVEDSIQQRISPLRLVSEKVFEEYGSSINMEPKQLTEDNCRVESKTTALVPVEVEVVEWVIDLTEDMFPEVVDGIEIRSLLRTEDLRLLRRVFIHYAKSDMANGDVSKCRQLMERMMRKAKKRR